MTRSEGVLLLVLVAAIALTVFVCFGVEAHAYVNQLGTHLQEVGQ
ncbi:MAG TPA: hypothetical protein VFY10_11515 [Dehalococcoidia bacterium]|nr:hypothetical protein [Dehalococcoidia bacterium]